MGMSASQARFLMLTARRSDIEYQVQQINQERLNLSENMEGAGKIYTDKISNTMLVYRSTQDNTDYTLSYDVITKSIADGGMGLYLTNDAGKFLIASEDERANLPEDQQANCWVDENLKDREYLERNLQDGTIYISNGEAEQYSIDGMSDVKEVADESDDAQAQAEYDTRMASLQRQDKMLELQLTQLESEHQAIQTEIDSIKDVINKDIESSFKTFGS